MLRKIACLVAAALSLAASEGRVQDLHGHERSLQQAVTAEQQAGGNTCDTAECRDGLLVFFTANVGTVLAGVGSKCGPILEFGVTLAQTCARDLETVTPNCECSAACMDAVSTFSAECLMAVRDALCELSDKARADGVEVVDTLQNFGQQCNKKLLEDTNLDLQCPQKIEPYSAEKVCGTAAGKAAPAAVQQEAGMASPGGSPPVSTSAGGRRLHQADNFIPENTPALPQAECLDPAPCRAGVSDWLIDNAVDLLAEVDNCDLIGLATSLQDACGAELLKGGSCPCSDECQTALLDIEPACVASLGEFMCSRAVEARQDGVELKETVVSLTERCYNPGRSGDAIIDTTCPDVPPLVPEEVCPPEDSASEDDQGEEDSEDDDEDESLVDHIVDAAAAVGSFFGSIIDAVESIKWPWD